MVREEIAQTILNLLEEFVNLKDKEGIRLEIVHDGTRINDILRYQIKKLRINVIGIKLLLLHNMRRKLKEIRLELAAYYQCNGFPNVYILKRFVIVPVVGDKFFIIEVDTD
jgi:hypothetical protein